jgi:hypothetical protein
MDIKTLKKEELLKIRDEIDSQLKYIDELKIEVKKSKEKKSLADLDKNDKIFCVMFHDTKIYNMGYVEIKFYEMGNFFGWTNFSTSSINNATPMGCSSCIKNEYMSNYFFLSVFGKKSYYFFTLKPENWRNDFKMELIRLMKEKEISFNKEMLKVKETICEITEGCENVDEFIENLEE